MKMSPNRLYLLEPDGIVRARTFGLNAKDHLLKRAERLLCQRKGKTLKELAGALGVPETECRNKLRELLSHGAQVRVRGKTKDDEYRFRLEGYCIPNRARGELTNFPSDVGEAASSNHCKF